MDLSFSLSIPYEEKEYLLTLNIYYEKCSHPEYAIEATIYDVKLYD